MYQVQQTDEGYQILLETMVQEYPPQIVSTPLEHELVYASHEDALKRAQELNKHIRQKLGRVVEITIQCTLEFLTFTDKAAMALPGEVQPGMVHFLMRLLEPLTHADADGPLRNLLSQVVELAEVSKASFSFQVLEYVE
jgi:hypothetical protein